MADQPSEFAQRFGLRSLSRALESRPVAPVEINVEGPDGIVGRVIVRFLVGRLGVQAGTLSDSIRTLRNDGYLRPVGSETNPSTFELTPKALVVVEEFAAPSLGEAASGK